MPTYTACEGTGQPATEVRVMRTAGLGSKFAHLNGKNAGKCSACGKSSTLGKGITVMPRHKSATVN